MSKQTTGVFYQDVENIVNPGRDFVEIISFEINERTGQPFNVIAFVVNHARRDKRTGVFRLGVAGKTE